MAETSMQGHANEPSGRGRRTALTMLLASLAVILAANFLVRGLVESIVSQNAPDWPFNPAVSRIAGMAASRLLEVAAVFAALALLFRLTRYGSFADLGLRLRGLVWLPLGLVMPLLALIVGALALWAAGALRVERLLYPGPWPTVLVLAAATQAGFVEELGFRGALMQAVERLVGGGTRAKVIAIVVSAVLFAVLHLLAPFKLTWAWWVVVVLAGLGCGYAFYATGRNLWLPIGLHWGFDLGVFLLLGLPGESRGWLVAPTLGAFPSLSQTGGYVMLIGAVLTTLALALLVCKGWRRERASERTG